jgi:hypothetical protein
MEPLTPNNERRTQELPDIIGGREAALFIGSLFLTCVVRS